MELAAVEPLEGIRDYVVTGIEANKLAPEKRNSFSVLLLLDVIEHPPDPKTFLSDLMADFPQVRHVIITVPARAELWSTMIRFTAIFAGMI